MRSPGVMASTKRPAATRTVTASAILRWISSNVQRHKAFRQHHGTSGSGFPFAGLGFRGCFRAFLPDLAVSTPKVVIACSLPLSYTRKSSLRRFSTGLLAESARLRALHEVYAQLERRARVLHGNFLLRFPIDLGVCVSVDCLAFSLQVGCLGPQRPRSLGARHCRRCRQDR